MEELNEILSLSNSIRYVAIYRKGILQKKSKKNLDAESNEESDKYEELLVNPAILKLAQQRGDIDCGGMNFVIISYGNFYQLVKVIPEGHISIAIDNDDNPIELYPVIEKYISGKWKK